MPANLVTQRQQTTSPSAEARPELITPEGAVRRSQSDPVRQQPSEQSPQLAETPRAMPNRRQPVTVAPSDADALAPQVTQTASTDASAAEAQPTDTSVAKQSAQQRQPWPTPGPAIETVNQSSRRPATSIQARVASDQSAPSTSDPADLPAARRAIKRALVAVSPVNSPSEGTINSDQSTTDPAASPAQTAISVAERGVAGEGRAPNLDQGDAAPQTPVSIASASAQRERPSQQTRTGPSIAPAAGARVPRGLAGANMPTTNLRAQTDAAADRVDAVTLAPIEANAAAGETLRQANAPLAQQTAQRGTSKLDIGPLRIASNLGQRQPSGGGQPSVVQGMMNAPTARSRVGGTSNPALAVPEPARVVASPPNRDRQDNQQSAGAAERPIDRQSVATSASTSPRPEPSPDASSVSDTAARLLKAASPHAVVRRRPWYRKSQRQVAARNKGCGHPRLDRFRLAAQPSKYGLRVRKNRADCLTRSHCRRRVSGPGAALTESMVLRRTNLPVRRPMTLPGKESADPPPP